MGDPYSTVTPAMIADLDQWAEVYTRDLHYAYGHLMVRSAEVLIESPVLQRHMRYHARKERAQ